MRPPKRWPTPVSRQERKPLWCSECAQSLCAWPRGETPPGASLRDAERQRGIAAFAALVRAQIDVLIRQIGTVLPGGRLGFRVRGGAARCRPPCGARKAARQGGAERPEIRVRRQQEGHAAAVGERLGNGRLRAEKIRAGLTLCGLNDLDAAELCKEQRLSKRKLRIVYRTRGERTFHQISVHLLARSARKRRPCSDCGGGLRGCVR